MTDIHSRIPEPLSGRIRLNTLILLRWTAVTGQAVALLVAWQWFGVRPNIAACLALIATSVAANLLIVALYPAQRRLEDHEAMAMLSFDLVQLSAMLALTGGMNNPFALLLLAPVTISATALRRRQTMLLGALTLVLISVVAWLGTPLRTVSGGVIAVPRVFAFGHWLAILIGVVFMGLYARRVATEIQAMAGALFSTQIALAREQRLCDLGGVVAAAAHELGTPLATIKLTSSELADELEDLAPARPELIADAQLIREQADRCSAILRQMGRAGKDDLQLRSAPLEAILQESAMPHQDRGPQLHFELGPAGALIVARQPELIHGLRNLIQNGVDFARANVWIEGDLIRLQSGESGVVVRISDDGAGYPPNLLPRIGDPFISRRKPDSDRPAYEGMGLGLFIAKTLLERTGARLRFFNGDSPFLTGTERPKRAGANVELTWLKAQIESRTPPDGLGLNPSNSYVFHD